MSLYFRDVGPRGAPTIVFLHGGGVSGWMWEPQMARLPGYHCLVPDLPEHGRSADSSPFSIAGASRLVADLITGNSATGKASVVGLSLGGQVILQLLNDRPELVERAVVSGALTRPVAGSAWLGLLTGFYWPLRSYRPLVLANMRAAGIPEAYLEQMREETNQARLDSLLRVTRASLAFRLPRGLANVVVPTLVLVGGKERRESRLSARGTALALPSARSLVVPGVGHTWNLQAPDLFTSTVTAWIERRPLPASLRPLAL